LDWPLFWPWAARSPLPPRKRSPSTKLSGADTAKVKAALAEIGCGEREHAKHEEEGGVYEIDDANCKMGTMDIKLDKDFKILLISRY